MGKRSVLYIPHFFALINLITINLITINLITINLITINLSLMIPKHLGAVMNLVDRVTLALIVVGSAVFFLATLLYNSELCLP